MGLWPSLRLHSKSALSRLSSIAPNNAITSSNAATFRTAAILAVDPITEDAATHQLGRAVPRPPFRSLQFDDPKQAFQAKSTGQLVQSLAVFSACSVKPLVQNADSLLAATRRIAAPAVDYAVKHTLFRHFCGGECVESIQPTLQYLEHNGIRPILNYAAEDDVSGGEDTNPTAAAERKLDGNMNIFMRSIHDSDNTRNRAFVAIKVTALGPPNLLEKMSAALAAMGDPLDRGHASAQLRVALSPHLEEPELASLDNMMRRLDTLADAVVAKGNSRILVDAEHTYMQPAIDALTIRLMQRCNSSEPVIMNTYQCYLKDTAARLARDARRAAEEGWKLGVKTVRGAYMVVERARAEAMGYPSPVQDTLQATHDNYNRCVERVLHLVTQGEAELMVASHNQVSVDKATQLMHTLGLDPSTSGVYFGQLLGMADHLSFTLGRGGYRIHKIVPYGPVHETLQYLIRRAQENSDVLGGCGKERRMIRAELMRRLREGTALGRLLGRSPNGQHAAASA